MPSKVHSPSGSCLTPSMPFHTNSVRLSFWNWIQSPLVFATGSGGVMLDDDRTLTNSCSSNSGVTLSPLYVVPMDLCIVFMVFRTLEKSIPCTIYVNAGDSSVMRKASFTFFFTSLSSLPFSSYGILWTKSLGTRQANGVSFLKASIH